MGVAIKEKEKKKRLLAVVVCALFERSYVLAPFRSP